LWEEDGNGRLVCVAKGSKDGKPRNERICTVPRTFGLSPVVEIGVNAPVDAAPVNGVPNTTTGAETVQTDDSTLSNEVDEKLKIQDDKPAVPQTTVA
jgi:hypothetical protein